MAGKDKKGERRKRDKDDSASETPLPEKSQILEFIQSSDQKVGKREIARAFNIKGGQRIALKRVLREMADEGLIDGRRKNISRPGHLPPVAVLSVTHMDDEGDLIARPEKWDSETEAPKLLIAESKKTRSRDVPGIGDRVLARIDKMTGDAPHAYPYEARIIKKLPKENRELLGIFRRLEDGSGLIGPVDRKILREWSVLAKDCMEVSDGELVRFMPSKGRHYGPMLATISARLGNPDEQKSISLIAVHRHGIPDKFPSQVLDELEKLPPLTADKRTDLRALPLITIDPFDARDHDDAIHAAPDTDENNKGGFVLHVAIADVAHYVRPGSELDREALKRGNSVYFPDRVVPMLPEKISNDLCSLRENEERPCLAVRMRFDANGHKIGHIFLRGLMRSHAKLSYEQAQNAINGQPDEAAQHLLEPVLKPLWQAWTALMKARATRHPLELDLPERKILMSDDGRIDDILTPDRLDAHKVVEEFMIQANVCAAESLDQVKSPVIYRIHPAPSFEKIQSLADFLQTLKIKFARNAQIAARQFNDILRQVEGSEVDDLVNETVLRSQSQAEYNIVNEGHFGLNLRQYAHFTSPIRRYADLVVHRALIRAFGFGEGGLSEKETGRLDKTASEISDLERRAMAAERETVDRLIAFHLADRVGAQFAGRISGVTRSGLFVRLSETGADGFIPASSIGREYYYHDEQKQSLIGEDTGETYTLGASVNVRLVEAIPTAGALRFEMLSKGVAGESRRRGGRGAKPHKRSSRKSPKGRKKR